MLCPPWEDIWMSTYAVNICMAVVAIYVLMWVVF